MKVLRTNQQASRTPRRRPGKTKKLAIPCDVLRLVAFSDYREQDISLLLQFLSKLRPKPHLILYAGDDGERFHSNQGNRLAQLASCASYGLCAVLGNAVPQSGTPIETLRRAYLTGKNVHDVHTCPLVLGSYAVIGSEGTELEETLGNRGGLCYAKPHITRHLLNAAERVKGKHLIVLSHCPPHQALDQAIRFGKRSIGSVALRQFVLRNEHVPLVVCGHVHACGAQTTTLQRATVVNAASHDDFGDPGRVAVLSVQSGEVVAVTWHLLWELGSISGVGGARLERLQQAGIRTVQQLAAASPERVRKALNCGVREVAPLVARARSLLLQDAVLFDVFIAPQRKRAYIDIETDLSQRFIWLVGLRIEEQARTYSFFADTPAQEEAMLIRLLAFLRANSELRLLSYSNCAFEQRVLPRRLSANRLPTAAIDDIQDIYQNIHQSVALPCRSTTVKEISRWCGFQARHPDMDGWEAAVLYGSGALAKSIKRKLIEYNEDDLLALEHIVRYIEERCGVTREHISCVVRD